MAVEITTWAELAAINSVLDGDYILMNDLGSGDADYDTYASSTANSGSGWTPLGNSSTSFTGIFDGGDFMISDIVMVCGTRDYNGLFGYVDAATMQNIKISNINISEGDDYTGALTGYTTNLSTATNCYVSGQITCSETDNYIGGLIGRAYNCTLNSCGSEVDVIGGGSVGGLTGYLWPNSAINCYAHGSVTGIDRVGGLTGYAWQSSIINCYSTALVSGSTNTGGLIGYNNAASSTDCFWNTETSNQSSSAGTEVGKTTTEMKTLSTYSTWSIVTLSNFIPASPTIWYINETFEYPKLGITYEGYEQLSGKVTLNTSDIEGAEVTVLRPTDNTIINKGTTDVNGDYSLGVEIGTYHVMVQHEDGGTKYNAESYPYVVVS